MTMNEMGARAKTAARALANAGALKESALLHAAGALRQRREELGMSRQEREMIARDNFLRVLRQILDRKGNSQTRL